MLLQGLLLSQSQLSEIENLRSIHIKIVCETKAFVGNRSHGS